MDSVIDRSPAASATGSSALTCAQPPKGEPYLLTPGPLTTAFSTKEAMLRDWGSWDGDFRAMTALLRSSLLEIAGDTAGEYDCVPLQGSGSYCVEAMLGSLMPRDAHALVLANGAYGKRIATTLGYLGRACTVLDKGDYLPPRGAEKSFRRTTTSGNARVFQYVARAPPKPAAPSVASTSPRA